MLHMLYKCEFLLNNKESKELEVTLE